MADPPDRNEPAERAGAAVDLCTETRTSGPDTARATAATGIAPGQILGERYRIEALLGRGGMGEVWRAYDLKLRVEVALKTLTGELFTDARAFKLVRREVRAAREVVSPNVCRIFDLVEVDGHELVSMEHIDGATLLGLLREEGPLELRAASEIASQLLAGLEAIHGAGLVHRDVKPENVMLTRAGRVVLMDFGLAASKADAALGLRAGTPAYMSPEQQRGEGVDARTDVYATGLVLAEMICAEGLSDDSTRQTLWKALRHDPPAIPESPWRRILLRAVAKDREERFESAAALARALEEVAFRIEGAEDRTPYPGLSSFKEQDAEFFFGREAEVESVWKKLEHATLLGIIGASGSGKSSFVRAGLIPAKPEGWGHVICQPGSAPFAALGQVLLPEVGRDDEAMRELIALEDPQLALSAIGRWRRRHDEVLLIVDQFEELFTQNRPGTQRRFAELLGRLARETEVHVLLAMRDDFLMECTRYESLAPVLSELTGLHPPTGSALRRALIQPALACGYRFAEEAMVEEMLAEVTKERGALPLIAFTAARLWEHRDQETGHLTRQAYDEMGGVGGALARHAEATLERIGRPRQPIVRELFRNLVTAQGTRAARDVEELLSIFVVSEALASGAPALASRSVAVEVLHRLIDARLLTSFEVPVGDGQPAPQRVEIIHESLLTAWPRLVRWQAQDADSAKLRDELRHAAALWEERGRPDDLLWTGTAYREFLLWRERYPGRLTAVEDAFAEATVAFAERRRKRRRIAIASSFVVLLVVLGTVGAFWRNSVLETRRAEAANLFSLAQLRIDDHPSATVAFATASLELADLPEARRLVVEALWHGPTEIRLPAGDTYPIDFSYGLDFSPDGRWLATEGGVLWPSDGGPPTVCDAADKASEGRFGPRGDVVAYVMGPDFDKIGLWSVPSGRFLRFLEMGGAYTQNFWFSRGGERLIATTEFLEGERGEALIRFWPLDGGDPDLVARFEFPRDAHGTWRGVDPAESRVGWVDGSTFHLAPLNRDSVSLVPTASLEHDRPVGWAVFDGRARRLATAGGRTVKVWSVERDPPELIRTVRDVGVAYPKGWAFDASGSRLGFHKALVQNLAGPPDAEPLRLRRDMEGWGAAFHPSGRWFATAQVSSISLWPIARAYPEVLPGHEGANVHPVAFTPGGSHLVSASPGEGSVRVWPLGSRGGERSRVLYRIQAAMAAPRSLAVAPDGSFVVIGTFAGQVRVLPLDGGPVRELTGFKEDLITGLTVGPGSRLVAAGAGFGESSDAVVRVWDLETGETRVLDAGDGKNIDFVRFTRADKLAVAGGPRLRFWDLGGPAPRIREEIELGDDFRDLSPNGRRVLFQKEDRLWIHDRDEHVTRELVELGAIGTPWRGAVFDPTGTVVVAADRTGAIRVGAVRGGEPHLLLGHEGGVGGVGTLAVSPDGRWIASADAAGSIRLWPMPDLSKPPLHTLPRDELLAKLRTLTNLRAVEDPDSPTGWTLEVGPFPGWETVPTW